MNNENITIITWALSFFNCQQERNYYYFYDIRIWNCINILLPFTIHLVGNTNIYFLIKVFCRTFYDKYILRTLFHLSILHVTIFSVPITIITIIILIYYNKLTTVINFVLHCITYIFEYFYFISLNNLTFHKIIPIILIMYKINIIY